MHRRVITINHQFRTRGLFPTLVLVLAMLLLLVLLIACSGGMSDDEKEIAVAIGLTQTAAALGDDAETASVSAAETPIPPTTMPTTVPPTTMPPTTMPPTTSVSVPVTMPTAVVAAVPAPIATSTPAPAATATTDRLGADVTLPLTQQSRKVRTLLVAPGEPGRLYALLTDATDDATPALGAQLLTSTDFGERWVTAPSGLPVEAECLFNLNMDYYGATALYASTCQGIYRWLESEPNWTLVTPEQTGMVAVVYGNADLLWATKPFGTDGAPLLLSQNGGESWTAVNLAHTNGVAAVGISPRDSQSGYAIVWPGGEGSALRRGTIFTDWQVMPAPQAGLPVNTGLTIDGGTGWIYVTTNEAAGDRLWRSSDADTPIVEDVSWEEVYHFATGDHVELLASGWSSNAEQLAIYANLQREVNGEVHYTLIRSLDNGQSWAPLIIVAA